MRDSVYYCIVGAYTTRRRRTNAYRRRGDARGCDAELYRPLVLPRARRATRPRWIIIKTYYYHDRNLCVRSTRSQRWTWWPSSVLLPLGGRFVYITILLLIITTRKQLNVYKFPKTEEFRYLQLVTCCFQCVSLLVFHDFNPTIDRSYDEMRVRFTLSNSLRKLKSKLSKSRKLKNILCYYLLSRNTCMWVIIRLKINVWCSLKSLIMNIYDKNS